MNLHHKHRHFQPFLAKDIYIILSLYYTGFNFFNPILTSGLMESS